METPIGQYDNPVDLIRLLADIGVKLSAEKDLDRLLEAIIDSARLVTHADGGTLYLVSEDRTKLEFAIIQNDTLEIRMGGTGGAITWPPVPLYHADGTENHLHVSAHVAVTGDIINISDVYRAEGFDFEGTREFDRRTGYRSRSMLVIPMRDHEQEIIGVVQLLNAVSPQTGKIVPFDKESQLMGESLSSQAAVAWSKSRLIHDLQRLLQSFITSIGHAIDEKSPYTGEHVRRVAELTQIIARAINDAREGPFAEVFFTDDELEELKMAAWLHDVGKITTPEYVVDKATKLETLFDRIELVRMRMEVLIRERRISLLVGKEPGPQVEVNDPEISAMKEDMDFLDRVNKGAEPMNDTSWNRLYRIAKRRIFLEGRWCDFLTEDELENLSVKQGTLTDREREIINNHVAVTYSMLSQLPFPRKLKHVPTYAGSHHERLDGSGYHRGLTKDELPLQARIIALADIFESLTARNRPYKTAFTLQKTIDILHDMALKGQIDADLFSLAMNSGLLLAFVGEKRY